VRLWIGHSLPTRHQEQRMLVRIHPQRQPPQLHQKPSSLLRPRQPANRRTKTTNKHVWRIFWEDLRRVAQNTGPWNLQFEGRCYQVVCKLGKVDTVEYAIVLVEVGQIYLELGFWWTEVSIAGVERLVRTERGADSAFTDREWRVETALGRLQHHNRSGIKQP